MKTLISGIYFDKGIAAVSLIEETLSDGSKVFNITIGEHELNCINENRAIECFTQIARSLHASVERGIVVI